MSRNPRSTGDVGDLLAQAGGRDTPPPDPAFAEALEARLRAVAASMQPAAPASTPTPPPARAVRRMRVGWVRPLLVGAAVLALVVAAVGQGTPALQPPGPPLELTAAVNVTVQLADGTTIENPEGMVLPEGAIVTVGPGGSATIGNVTVSPGEVAVVHGGRAQVERPKPATPETAVVSPHPSSASATPSATASGPGASGTPVPSAAPSPAPSASEDPGSTQAPSPSAAPSPKPVAIVAPRLRAALVAPHTFAVTWTRTAGAKSYVLVITRAKAGVPARPVYPGGRVLATFTKPPAAPAQFVLAKGVLQVKLLVVALDSQGRELARSRVVRVIVALPAATPSPAASPSPAPSAS